MIDATCDNAIQHLEEGAHAVTPPGALYYALCEQIRLSYDALTVFHPATGLDGSLTETEEYPFCFIFALFLRTLRELGDFPHVEVWCERVDDHFEVRYFAGRGAPARYLARLKRMYSIFSPYAKEAGVICRTAKRQRTVSLLIHAPLYEGVRFTLGAISSDAIRSAVADAFALDLTEYI